MEEITITVQESGIGVPSGGTTGQALVKKTNSSFDTEWADVEDVGGAVTSVNGAVGVVILDADDISDTSTTNKFVTSADITKLSNLSGTNTGDQDLSSYLTSVTAASTYEPLKGVDDNYVTDAEKVVIGNTIGVNTGDQIIPVSGVDFDPVGTDNSDNNAVNSLYSGLASSKQDALVSGTNIKTINGATILGSGDIVISGGTTTEKDVLNHGFFADNERMYERWVERINIASGGETVSGASIDTFRIPTCVFCSNGDLLISCEARFDSDSDSIDAGLFLGRLRGNNILEKEILIEVPIGKNKVSNPNFLKDGDRVYLFYTVFDVDGTPTLTNDVQTYYTYSDDNGVTWVASIEYLASDQNSGSAFKWMNSPANSIKHSSGNIIIPIWGKYVAGSTPTWFRSGIVVWDGVSTFTKRILDAVNSINEPTVYEADNGDIVMSCRTGSTGANNRVVYRTPDLGVTWIEDDSTGAGSFSVYVNIKRYADSLYRLEIDSGVNAGIRKNLNLYKTDLTNKNYLKVLDITERDLNIWGYGCSDNYLDRFVVISEDKPDLNLYNVYIEDKGVINVNRKKQQEYLNFLSPLKTDGDDVILGLTATNGGAATFNGSMVSFNGTDTSYLTWADNDIFDFYDSVDGVDVPSSIAFMFKLNDYNGTTSKLFFHKSGASGTNRTWDLRLHNFSASTFYLKYILYSELNSSNQSYFQDDTIIALDTWYHVVATQDGKGNPIIYVNNIKDGFAATVGASYVKMGNSSNVVTLGRLLSSSSFNINADFYGLTVAKGRVFTEIEREWLYQMQRNSIDII